MKNQDWTVSDIPSQVDKVAIVTGGNSGIGWHTALELARAGAEVILTARTVDKGRDAVERICRDLPKANVRYELLDLANLASTATFADRMCELHRHGGIDLLVNNAGVMSIPERRLTADGFEMQFGTNFLGPFALTARLMPVLRRSMSARVTTVSSGAANMGKRRIEFDNLQSERSYHHWNAYCQSKLADLLFTQELARRSAAAGIDLISNAAHPGYAITNLQSTGPGRSARWYERLFAKIAAQDAAGGALPTLRAATAPEAFSGTYFAPDGPFQLKGAPVRVDLPRVAQDREAAKRLWEAASALTEVDFGLSAGQNAVIIRETRWTKQPLPDR